MDRKRKRELRDINLRVWEGAHDVFAVSASLDSSLKKNTAFIKRLRTGISASAQAGLLSEIKTLSLQKYLSEIISATAEGLSRLKIAGDIAAGIEVVSALHQRFGPAEFTKQLGWLLGRGLTSPDKAQVKQWTPEVKEREEKDRLARHRVLLRIVTDFWLCGVLRSLDDVERPEEASGKAKDVTMAEPSRSAEAQKLKNALNGIKNENMRDHDPFPLEVLKDLLGHDMELVNLPLAVLFVKNFAWDILGMKPPSDDARKQVDGEGEVIAETNGAHDPNDAPLIAENVRQRFVNVIDRYAQFLKKRILKDQQSLNNQSKRNAEAYVRSGEIFEDRQTNFEKQQKAQEKLIASAQTLCDILGQDMPDLTDKEGPDFVTAGAVGIVKAGEVLRGTGEGPGIWEDEDERRFYENLVDLKGRVPAILLEDSKKVKPDTDEAVPARSTEGAVPESSTKVDDASVQIANRTVGAQVDALLLRLPDLLNKDQVDSLAYDFCFLNSKASRNRLLKSLQDIPKGRSDLLPLYARLIATLGQYMPDLLNGMITYLDDEFRSLQRRKTKDFLGQTRLVNMRYLAELTKFGGVPEHVIFHCFKVSLDDFSRMNIEIIAHFLENCGRYLLRNPETAPRMSSFLETLGRKKSAQHLGAQERMLIENALYYVDPPERAAIEQKERTPIELFVRQLVYMDMTKRNYMKILKTIRKLHWEEAEIVTMLEKIFSKPGKVKFSSIHLLAVLLGALARHHQDFVITIIDNVLENIMLGLEQNDFKFNQRRIAEVKYLGELYNYKMVDSSVVFDALYRIVTFGHEGGTPAPGRTTPFDALDDFFRVRLVCTILDTCGTCFDRGTSRKKLDFFLTFFQYYVLTKDPLPMEIDFLIQDTLAVVRPQWKLVTDLDEAAKAFAEAVQTKYKQEASDRTAEDADDGENSSDEDALGEEENAAQVEAHDSSGEEGEEGADEQSDNDEAGRSSSDEEHIVVVREEEKLDPEAEAEFDREFAAMMSESLDSRKNERQNRFDVPLPVRKAQRPIAEVVDEGNTSGNEAPPPPAQGNTMAFQLMTKKGNRQQTRTIDLPSDSHFALSMKSQQAAEREEQLRIKNLVLNYDLGEDDQHDGTEALTLMPIIQPTLKSKKFAKDTPKIGYEHNFNSLSRAERQSRAPRARRLNLSDVDWYARQKSDPAGAPKIGQENGPDTSQAAVNQKKPG
ncbi:mRNA decay protein [Knufia obscura]|uniref:mRNA decay protein n=1 Tax=Knufia obscura TaxID=1635080 RepID=A0ABR0RVR4_9EURO|nr:mRNA decay protein [Knufia obscura]